MSELGHARIVGRLKDMIIRGGENIYPREIEDFLHTHPEIQEAQVFSIPDFRLGEEVCAWLKLSENSKLSVEDIKAFSKGKVLQICAILSSHICSEPICIMYPFQPWRFISLHNNRSPTIKYPATSGSSRTTPRQLPGRSKSLK